MKLAKSHNYHKYCKECLEKESREFQEIVKNNPRGNLARLFKQDCMVKFIAQNFSKIS